MASVDWAGILQILVDLLSRGVGVPCLAGIFMMLLCMYILYRMHLYVIGRILEELNRVSQERTEWQRRFFDGLKSSGNDYYATPPEG